MGEESWKILEEIVAEQRTILSEEMGRPAEEIPQLWCLYKEVQQYYEEGMRVPDDVILLWSDDNWGNLRRLLGMAQCAAKLPDRRMSQA